MLGSTSSGQIAVFTEPLLSSVSSLISFVLVMFAILIFLAMEGAIFGDVGQSAARPRTGAERIGGVRQGHPRILRCGDGLGGIVAVLDAVALLLILGSRPRDSGLWWRSSPTMCPTGFIIGLVPPAILGLLVGGPGLAVTVIVVYCLLNFIIQSVLQPEFVGEAAGLRLSPAASLTPSALTNHRSPTVVQRGGQAAGA
jgi:hypothetical protein